MTRRLHLIPPQAAPSLLTPREAAFHLLEAATLRAFRTNGMAGIRPVLLDQAGRQVGYRAAEVHSVAERIALGTGEGSPTDEISKGTRRC